MSQMSLPKIPHAEQLFVVRKPPRNILHIVTSLYAKPETPGFDPDSRLELMQAVLEAIGANEALCGYVVHSPDCPALET